VRRWLRTLPAAYVSAIVIWFIAAPINVLDYLAKYFICRGCESFPNFVRNELLGGSLSIEELFYVLFPIVLYVLIKKLPQQRAFLMTIGIVAGIAFISRMLLIWYLPYSPDSN
jgi:peptidoglycan/LPS O-acetylase OafA/YrhL